MIYFYHMVFIYFYYFLGCIRNSAEITSSAMRGGQSNGGVVRGIVASPDRAGAHDKKVTHTNHNSHHHHHHQNENNINHNNKSAAAAAASSETAHDSKKGGGGGSSSGGSGDAGVAGAGSVVWPPKFVIALTNKEKEEDFMAIKGSKLPQRPKKRAKFIQRTLNVSPFFLSLLKFYFIFFQTKKKLKV